MPEETRDKANAKMDKAIEALKRELSTIRTGRASLALLDGINVDYYGTPTPLSQLASLSIPDPRMITVQPWEQNLIPEVEKAILRSDLGITPSNDGKLIRLAIPMLSEERRKEMVKLAHKKGEDCKIAIRNIRREINDQLKKKEKDKEMTEDECKRSLDEIQKVTDSHVKNVDTIVSHKEAEIMEI